MAVFGHFLAIFELKSVRNHVIYLSPMAHYLGNIALCKNNAEMCSKCAQTSFFGPILAKKCIFDPRKFFFLLFSFQKWIPLEKLDIKHVLYDFLHAISIIFKGVKKNVSIALSNYTRNRCDLQGTA